MIYDLKNLKSEILNLIFPPVCVGCGEEGFWMCRVCLGALRLHENNYCPLCKKPSLRGFLCVRCRGHSPLAQLVSAFVYDERMKRVIHAIKFGGVSICIASFAPYLREVWQRFGGAQADVIIPVPLHIRRLRERGFNQAAEVARAFSADTPIPVLTDVLVRTRATHAQAELARGQRSVNVAQAFLTRRPEEIVHKAVLMVDDVFTTGATLNAAACALRAAGARTVSALTLAHG